jgi:hypothetical protein
MVPQMTPDPETGTPVPREGRRIVVFPTFAHFDDAAQCWRLRIHGWVFEPVHESLVRRTLVHLMPRMFGVHANAEQSDRLRRRIWPFVASGASASRLELEIGGKRHPLPETGADGHVRTMLTLPADALPTDVDNTSRRAHVRFEVYIAAGTGPGAGEVELIPPRGISVVSDIDDTIKISQVTDRQALLSNTFLHPFRAVPGMSEVYRRWEAQGASFHYVSGSPWQLYEPLRDLMREERFPPGSMDMRTVLLRQLRLVRFGRAREEGVLGPPTEMKRAALREILQTFPARKFVLCGDTGEEDPELYGELAAAFPAQVRRVYLRIVSPRPADQERVQRAFAATPECCRLFHDPAELPAAPI